MNNTSYEDIKDSIIFSFEEYINTYGFTPQQATSKIFEEDLRWLTENDFTVSCYFVLSSIECIRRNEIPDFLFDKLKYYLEISEFKALVADEEVLKFFNDSHVCAKMLKENEYKVIETTFDTKLRIDYLLGLKNNR